MGIGIHNLSTSSGVEAGAPDLAAAVRQAAAGILGTTVQLADLVRLLPFYSVSFALSLTGHPPSNVHQVIPFVAGGFMYIGAVAVLPTYVHTLSRSRERASLRSDECLSVRRR